MRFADLKTGKKVMDSYFVVVLFLGIAIFFQITSMMIMSDLQMVAQQRIANV